MPMEQWLPIPGFDGYEASDRGNVRSLDRVVTSRTGWRRRHEGVVLKTLLWRSKRTGKTYRRVNLNNGVEMVQRNVAQLVLLAHVGPKPFPKAVSRHLNDDSLDDTLSNLAWGTNRDNEADKRRNGNAPLGERHGQARLTEANVLAIRVAASAGLTQREIAANYGVCRQTIGKIVHRKRWSHISELKEN